MYEMDRPSSKVLYYGLPIAVTAFAVDQGFRLAPRVIPMDLSKRASRVLLGGALSVGMSVLAGTIFEGRKRNDMMAMAFIGGMGSVIMRETMEA